MGLFRTSDPQRMARGLRGLLAHFEIEIAFDKETDSPQDQLETVFELLFYGLVGSGQRERDLS